MKPISLFGLLFITLFVWAQSDTARKIEPAQKSSFNNYELLILAVLGLLLLIGLRFWFRRTRKR